MATSHNKEFVMYCLQQKLCPVLNNLLCRVDGKVMPGPRNNYVMSQSCPRNNYVMSQSCPQNNYVMSQSLFGSITPSMFDVLASFLRELSGSHSTLSVVLVAAVPVHGNIE